MTLVPHRGGLAQPSSTPSLAAGDGFVNGGKGVLLVVILHESTELGYAITGDLDRSNRLGNPQLRPLHHPFTCSSHAADGKP